MAKKYETCWGKLTGNEILQRMKDEYKIDEFIKAKRNDLVIQDIWLNGSDAREELFYTYSSIIKNAGKRIIVIPVQYLEWHEIGEFPKGFDDLFGKLNTKLPKNLNFRDTGKCWILKFE